MRDRPRIPTRLTLRLLHASRARVLGFADLIVPGHGAPFAPSEATPR